MALHIWAVPSSCMLLSAWYPPERLMPWAIRDFIISFVPDLRSAGAFKGTRWIRSLPGALLCCWWGVKWEQQEASWSKGWEVPRDTEGAASCRLCACLWWMAVIDHRKDIKYGFEEYPVHLLHLMRMNRLGIGISQGIIRCSICPPKDVHTFGLQSVAEILSLSLGYTFRLAVTMYHYPVLQWFLISSEWILL